MTKRTTSLLPCVAVAVLAGVAATTIEFQPASAADECLTKPKETPAGKHWFYRIDRTTKKQCWYLRDDDRASQGASLVTRKLASHRDRTELSQSAADARAEIQPSPSQAADDVKVTSSTPSAAARSSAMFPPVAAASVVTPPAAMAPAAAAPTNAAPAAAVADSAAGDSALTSRWPDSSGTLQAQPAPAPRSNSYTLAAASSDAGPAETVAPTASSQTVAEAAPTASTGAGLDDPARTRLFAFLGAVAVAGFSTSVLLARARAKRQLRLEPVAARRVARWPAEPELDRMHLPPVDRFHPALARGEQPVKRVSQVSMVPRDDVRYDDQYEVEDLLARYSGQARRKS
ncbi:MAG: hypothetical protein E6614_03150 [Bradyrhizobium sp.]|jgi:hypothetical protein|uniref:Uncharacterized protein n=2 Tax=Bradyrhizobium TaxID=374 RepID=A0ABS5GBH9_9BRAD|nr:MULTISPECIES: hypothetical protein [Bradyrhizobium]MBR1137956.1 hypothetical protein [Bradyrhizobium denitrificans]MDU1493476.1 hypothetical protein [Bradyrhizobium sp.]MDU1543771.1 hypothetical protein [Bradyrhizobium sp.]MDU2925000.1 hypothetical protein [Bradyrhizobium sp.]MDU3042457.1 hypothetical protein [Bradyrhizobium sp.]